MEINTTFIQSLIDNGGITRVQLPTDTGATRPLYAGGLISSDRAKAMLYDSTSKEWYLTSSLNVQGTETNTCIVPSMIILEDSDESTTYAFDGIELTSGNFLSFPDEQGIFATREWITSNCYCGNLPVSATSSTNKSLQLLTLTAEGVYARDDNTISIGSNHLWLEIGTDYFELWDDYLGDYAFSWDATVSEFSFFAPVYFNDGFIVNNIDSSLFIHYDSAVANDRDICFSKGFRFYDSNESVSIENPGNGNLTITMNESSPRFFLGIEGFSANTSISASYLDILLRAGYDGGKDVSIHLDGEDGAIELEAAHVYAGGSRVMTAANFTLSPDGTTLTITTE